MVYELIDVMLCDGVQASIQHVKMFMLWADQTLDYETLALNEKWDSCTVLYLLDSCDSCTMQADSCAHCDNRAFKV